MSNHYNRRDYSHNVTRAGLEDILLTDARDGEATVWLWETVRDWVLEQPVDAVEVNYGGYVIADIPNTHPDIFGNGSSIDRANRKVIESGGLGALSDYVEDHPATGGGLVINVSELLRGRGEWADENFGPEVASYLDEIAKLRDYPVLDESIWCEIEEEENLENWVEYGARDAGILRDGERFKDDGSMALYLLGDHMEGADLLIAEHTGYDTTFTIDADDVDKARAVVAEYIVAE